MPKKTIKVVIVGGHEQACRIFEYLIVLPNIKIVLCIGRQDDTGIDGIFPSLLSRSKKHNITSLQPSNLNDEGVINTLKKLNPDIVLSLQNNMIFGRDWVKFFENKLGLVNIHYAPLPRYAGFWPEMWAIWNNETEFAVTMHYVQSGIDTGPIISQKFFDIDKDETRHSLYIKSDQNCYKMLVENLDAIFCSKVEAINQVIEKRTYFPKSLPNDGFMDLNWDAEKQSRFIRSISFPGFPGPKIKINDKVYTTVEEDLSFFVPLKIELI